MRAHISNLCEIGNVNLTVVRTWTRLAHACVRDGYVCYIPTRGRPYTQRLCSGAHARDARAFEFPFSSEPLFSVPHAAEARRGGCTYVSVVPPPGSLCAVGCAQQQSARLHMAARRKPGRTVRLSDDPTLALREHDARLVGGGGGAAADGLGARQRAKLDGDGSDGSDGGGAGGSNGGGGGGGGGGGSSRGGGSSGGGGGGGSGPEDEAVHESDVPVAAVGATDARSDSGRKRRIQQDNARGVGKRLRAARRTLACPAYGGGAQWVAVGRFELNVASSASGGGVAAAASGGSSGNVSGGAARRGGDNDRGRGSESAGDAAGRCAHAGTGTSAGAAPRGDCELSIVLSGDRVVAVQLFDSAGALLEALDSTALGPDSEAALSAIASVIDASGAAVPLSSSESSTVVCIDLSYSTGRPSTLLCVFVYLREPAMLGACAAGVVLQQRVVQRLMRALHADELAPPRSVLPALMPAQFYEAVAARGAGRARCERVITCAALMVRSRARRR